MFAGLALSQPPCGGDWLLPTSCLSCDRPPQSSHATPLFQIEISMEKPTAIMQMTWIYALLSAKISRPMDFKWNNKYICYG
jgi:hypothetical protein